MKHGALTPCQACGFVPELTEDKAKAMVLTDHFLPIQELEKAGKWIQSGAPLSYPQDAIDGFVAELESNPTKTAFGLQLGLAMLVGLFILALIAGIIIGLVG